MPSLILPSRFNQQPQQAAQLSSLARSLGFTHAFNFGEGGVKPVNSVTGLQSLSVGGTANAVLGTGGRAVQFSGSSSDRLEIAGSPFATSTCTYLWIESGIDNTGPGQSLTESRFSSDPASETGSLQIRIQGTSAALVCAQVAGGVGLSGRDNTGGVNVCAISVAGNNGRQAAFLGGRLAGVATPAMSFTHGISVIGGGSDCPSSTIKTYALFFAPKVIPDAVLMSLTAAPWQLFKAPPRRLWAQTAVAGAITGAFAATEGADTLAASGSVTFPAITGALSRTEGADTLSAAGTVAYPVLSGSLAVTEAPDTAAASGTVAYPGISGALASNESADTASAAGTVAYPAIAGTLASTEGSDTLAALGTVGNVISGSMAATEASDTASGTGTITNPVITGTLAATEGGDTASGSGTVAFPAIAGALAATEAPDVLSASGAVFSAITGTLAATEQPDTLAASDVAPAPPVSDGSGAGSWGEVRKYADLLDRADKPTKAQKKRRCQIIEAAVLELLPDEPAAERAAPIIAQLVARDQVRAMATWAPQRVLTPVTRQPVAMPAAVEEDMRARVQEWIAHQEMLAALEDEFETELLLLE